MKRFRDFDVELIATGNELLFGRLIDTNSAWIAKKVTEDGARIRRITCVGDDVQDIRRVIRESLSRKPHLIITTGGLGPSFDDKTIEAIAIALNKKRVLNERALLMLQTVFERRSQKRAVSNRLRRMAFLIENSEPLDNQVGLAPGMKLKVDETLIVALPGVPNEMKAIFERYLSPLIKDVTNKRIVTKCVRIMVERGSLNSVIQRILKEHPDVYVKIYAGDIKPGLGIKMDIMAEGENKRASEKTLKAIIGELRKLVEEKAGLMTPID